jgi:hypothetical protein
MAPPRNHDPAADTGRDTRLAIQSVANAINASVWAEARGYPDGHLAYGEDAAPGLASGSVSMPVRIAGVWYDLSLTPGP